MAKIIWLDEEDAAKFIKRKPETLRKRAKSGAWNVTYREIAGRSFQYSQADLERLYTVHKSA